MINLIDTIFNPVTNWLETIQNNLMQAKVPLSQSLPMGNLFNPIAMISPQWALLISNVFVMAFIYLIIYLSSNGLGLLERFRNVVKWW